MTKKQYISSISYSSDNDEDSFRHEDFVNGESEVTMQFIKERNIGRENYRIRREGGKTKIYLTWKMDRQDRNDLVRPEERYKKQNQMKARCTIHDERTGLPVQCPIYNNNHRKCNADCPYAPYADSGMDVSYEKTTQEDGHDFDTDLNNPERRMHVKDTLYEFKAALAEYDRELIAYLEPVFLDRLTVSEISRLLHTTYKKAKNRKMKLEKFVEEYYQKHPDVLNF